MARTTTQKNNSRKTDKIISPVFINHDIAEVESRAKGLEIVAQISETVHSERDFYGVIGQATNLILELTQFKAIAVFGYDNNTKSIDLITHQGLTFEEKGMSSKIALSDSFTSMAINDGKIVNTFDIGKNKKIDKQFSDALKSEGNNCIVSVPMIVQKNTIGAVNMIFLDPRKLTTDEEQILLSLGRTIGLALMNARYVSQIEHEIRRRERAEIKLKESNEKLEEEVSRQTEELNIANKKLKKINDRLTQDIQQKHYESITDQLTGLYNTPYFHVRIKAEAEHAKRYDHPLTLLFIDLNNFKRINQRLGYEKANEVIAGVGDIISNSIRKVDSAFRFSSKQFTVILSETNQDNSDPVSSRLIKEVSSCKVYSEVELNQPPAISIGVAQLTKDDSPENLIEKAKEAAARARAEGDNNITIYVEE